MGRMQRVKGSQGEREFFKLLSERLGVLVKRKLGQAREGGNDGDHGPLVIEVKRYKRFAVLKHLRQAEKACGADLSKIPIVALREDHGRWKILIDAEDFFKLAGPSLEVKDVP